jgi:diguanylate cyclase (GGDEF)-like protein
MDFITPLPTSDEDRALMPALREQLVAELERRGRTAVAVLIPVLLGLWVLERRAVMEDPALRWIFWGLAGTMAIRTGLCFIHRGTPEERHLRFTLGSTATSLLMALLVLISFRDLRPIEIGLLGMILAGVNSGALVSMAASLSTYLLYAGPMLSALIVASFLHPEVDYPHTYQFLAVLYLLGLTVLSLQVHRGLRQEILLRLRMEDFATRDPLTGLHNRRFLGEFMLTESCQTLRAWRQPESLHATVKLLIVDIDHFKQVNDVHGHAAGDAVLVQLSGLLRDVVRKPDLVVRWGGEEFLIVARHTTRELPLGLGERIRARVAAHAFQLPDGKVLKCSCSVGFALYPFLPDAPERLTWEQCVALADTGLYLAKREGRNRWVGLEAKTAWPEGGDAFLLAQQEPEGAEAGDLIRLIRGGPKEAGR